MKTFGKLFPLISILIAFLSWNGKTHISHAAVLNVPADYGTIQAAIDASNNGDTVLIADGTYTGSGNVNVDFKGKAITVESVNGPDNCSIDCRNIAGASGFLFMCCEQGGSVLRGLTIKNAHNADANGGGGGIFCYQSSPVIDNCVFENCRADHYGGGIYCLESSPIITNCKFEKNSAFAGAGINCNANAAPTISDCKFIDNVSGDVGSSICVYFNARPVISGCEISGTNGSGIWINSASAIISECVIYDNRHSGIAIASSTDTVITNCILRGNEEQSGLWCYSGANITAYNCLMTGNQGFGGLSCAGSSPKIVNCTIAGNRNGGINCFDEPLGPATTPTLINCIIWGNSGEGVQNWSEESPIIQYSDLQELPDPDIYQGGGTNISRNPAFANLDLYTLNASSPCRNRGRNSANPTKTDKAGNVRIHENVIDLGAYECGAPEQPEMLPSGIIAVIPGGLGNGSSWSEAADLQPALDMASAGNEIWVAKGVYKPSSPGGRSATFTLKNGVALYGGFEGTETRRSDRNWKVHKTILSGDIENNDTVDDDGVTVTVIGANAYHVVTGSDIDETAVLDGFVISGGCANGASGAENQGGGMLNWRSAPIVKNCVFQTNQAVHGGGMMNSQSDPFLGNCTFVGNSTTDNGNGGAMNNLDNSSPVIGGCYFKDNHSNSQGGAMINSQNSNPQLKCCYFSGNSAETHGGGMVNINSAPAISECEFDMNSARWGGGMMNTNSNAVITNCKFSQNLAVNNGNGGGINNYGAAPVITACVFSGNSSQMQGGAIINSDSCAAVISDCEFSGNSAQNGGGIFNYNGSSPKIGNCAFASNSATIQGGGIVNIESCNPSIVDCSFVNNSAENGGGIFNDTDCAPSVSSCIFTGNNAVFMGGGITGLNGCNPVIQYCHFSSNTAAFGGGAWLSLGSFSIMETVFLENQSTENGGGLIDIENTNAVVASCSFSGNKSDADGGGVFSENSGTRMINTVFSGNSADEDGGAVYVWKAGSTVTVTNCSFAKNSASWGGGVCLDGFGQLTVVNSVFWGNYAADIADQNNTAHVSYSVLQQERSGPGSNNVFKDPKFVRMPNLSQTSSDYGNLRLTPCSPASNAGDNGSVAGIPFDRDGNTRVYGNRVDMGAYESRGGICATPYHPSIDPRYVFVKSLYDDFSSGTLDTLKWTPDISGDPLADTYGIVGETALLTTEGSGERTVFLNQLKYTDSAYLEATVVLESGSMTSGESRAELGGIFYNDTFDEADPGNGYQGDVGCRISICQLENAGLGVRYAVGRFADFSKASEEILDANVFTMPIAFGTPYVLSIHMRNGIIVFTCLNDTNSALEQRTFSISTPIFPPKNHGNEKYLMVGMDNGGAGSLTARFDDVYVGQYGYADVNGDGTFNLGDPITALMILAGYNPTNVSLAADVGNNGKIGFEEAIYYLRVLASE